MNAIHSRRTFLTRGAAGIGGLAFLGNLPRLTASDTAVRSVTFSPEIEPLVRLVEDTPRERLLEEVAGRIRQGVTYRDVLASVLLAGVRNIQPRPVGFKFHAVLVVNSAHLAALNAPDGDRWLPLFWALDQFKASQARDVEEGDWTMAPVDEARVPDGGKARAAFCEAMDRWDPEAADAAVAGFARTAGAQEIFDVFCRYGARDFRDIGHKAIYVANSWRTLQTIGWQHAEPVLRSLAYALLEHSGGNPADADEDADRPGRRNLERIRHIRAGWTGGARSESGTYELLRALRTGTPDDTAVTAVNLLNRGVSPGSLWDACFQASAEMMMRRPGIVALHACTTTNALHFAFRQTSDDATRRFVLLQNCAFLPFFRDSAGARDGVEIDRIEMADGNPELGEIFAEVSRDRNRAARMALAYLESGGGRQPFLQTAQRLIYLKGTNSHDYKYSSAIFEDSMHLPPAMRNRFLSASVYWMQGSEAPDNALIARTRAAFSA